MSPTAHNQVIQLSIEGMRCAGCVGSVERHLSAVPGTNQVEVNFATGTAKVQGGNSLEPEALVEALQAHGYPARVRHTQAAESATTPKEGRNNHRDLWQKAAIAGGAGTGLMLADMLLGWLPPASGDGRFIWLGIGLLCLSLIGYTAQAFYSGAWQQLRQGSSNMDSLIALGISAAWFYSMLVLTIPSLLPSGAKHVYFEAALMIIAFVNVGNALESRARGRTGEAIERLMQRQPPTAHLVREGKTLDVPLSSIQLGDILRVRSGETVPLDGVLTQGQSFIDESLLTGESQPVAKAPGDKVTGGSQNGDGSFLLQVSHIGADTVLAQIIQMIEQAQGSKAPISRLVDRVASYFVPAVLLIALATFGLWYGLGPEPSLSYAIVTSLSVLVIACPCALGLATPIAIIAGIGKAAERGVLIRDASTLEQANKIDTVMFDKTGTLTQGKPVLQQHYLADQQSFRQALQLAASLEAGSDHPLAQCLRRAAQDAKLDTLPIEAFDTLAGQGVEGQHQGLRYYLGNAQLITEQGLSLQAWQAQLNELDEQAATPVFLAREDQVLALFGLVDPLKADAETTLKALQKRGLRVVMLTGDRQQVADKIGQNLGISEYHAELSPAGKLEKIQQWQSAGHRVAMVGDGINDAPALARAELGIAIGAGADVAIAAADITLMGDALQGVVRAFEIAEQTQQTIRQNLWGAFAYNSLGIPIAAGVLYPLSGLLLNPVLASAAMALSSLTVVLNANRLAHRPLSLGEKNP